MVNAFAALLIAVIAVFVIGGLLSMLNGGSVYDQIGGGGVGSDGRPAETPDSPMAQQEIRQMLQARSERAVRRGERPLDFEAELAHLANQSPMLDADFDPELLEEVRQLVQARNDRRVARGEQPLDVDREITRTLRELGSNHGTSDRV